MSVCAVMLTADRQSQTDRAVKAFLKQTYKNAKLLIYDTGKEPYRLGNLADSKIILIQDGAEMSKPIGAMRNTANGLTPPGTEIILHMDSDDVSGPYRIQDQVTTLLESNRDCVGYRSVMFWCAPINRSCEHGDGEAWAYHNINEAYCIGASFCYRKEAWRRVRFKDNLPGPERGRGEDKEWLRHVDSMGFPAIFEDHATLVCEIHGSNTMKYDLENEERGPTGWKRTPEWDAKLQSMMAL